MVYLKYLPRYKKKYSSKVFKKPLSKIINQIRCFSQKYTNYPFFVIQAASSLALKDFSTDIDQRGKYTIIYYVFS